MPIYYILTNSLADVKEPKMTPMIKGTIHNSQMEAEIEIASHARIYGVGKVLIKLECSKEDLKPIMIMKRLT